MSFSVAPLLIEGELAPEPARRALRAARVAPVAERRPHLEKAARILHRELDLDCDDARELVGLPADR
jgi:hypothetical protein